ALRAGRGVTRRRVRLLMGGLLVVAAACWLLLASRAPAMPVQPTGSLEVARASASWDGSPLPPYPGGQPEVRVNRITVPPGGSVPRHKHPYTTVGVVLAGRLAVIRDDGSFRVFSEGEVVVELP